jgi:hypothetical protein
MGGLISDDIMVWLFGLFFKILPFGINGPRVGIFTQHATHRQDAGHHGMIHIVIAKLTVSADAVKIGKLRQPLPDYPQMSLIAVFIQGVSLGIADHKSIDKIILAVETQAG